MEVLKILSSNYRVRDRLINLGTDSEGNPLLELRFGEIFVSKVCYSYGVVQNKLQIFSSHIQYKF